MPKRVRTATVDEDPTPDAMRVFEHATGVKLAPGQKNPAAVALGLLGGRKGGLARAANLSARRKKQIARQGAKARWAREGKH